MPKEKVFVLEDQYTGEPAAEKFKRVAQKMSKDASMMLLTTLDDIAWLLNLRGNDIEFNPVFFSFFILHKGEEEMRGDLFIDQSKIDAATASYLESIKVTVYDYSEVEKVLQKVGESSENKAISVNKSNCS
mmetsp:Transcript_12752/g.21512  ORF Transcript_12752/g.21512 Transcript_12752/m.21512 type:complete len:131 (+) Transcript_12752:476-868(+)